MPAAAKVDLEPTFATIRRLVAQYAKGLDVRKDTASAYELYSVKDVEMFGRKFREVFFASTVARKGAVSFYFFPIYTNPDAFELPPELAKARTGKSCFNFKKPIDAKVEKQLAALLKKGFALYRKQKWV